MPPHVGTGHFGIAEGEEQNRSSYEQYQAGSVSLPAIRRQFVPDYRIGHAIYQPGVTRSGSQTANWRRDDTPSQSRARVICSRDTSAQDTHQ